MWPTFIALCLAMSRTTPRKVLPRRRPAFRRPLLETLEERTVPSPLLTVSTVWVPGSAAASVSNSGTWQDTTAGATATLTTSYGSVTQNGNGTWTWSGTIPSQPTQVVIYNQDNQGGSVTTDFWLGAGQFFTVNTTADTAATNPTTGQDIYGNVSLRSAIQAVNYAQSSTPALIAFDIPGNGYQSIQPQSDLDPITAPVIIDGYTQPGSSENTLANSDNAVLRIELDAAGVPGNDEISSYALALDANSCTVQGLAINNYGGSGIHVYGNNNQIQGNFIGTDVSGTSTPFVPNFAQFGAGGPLGVRIDGGSSNVIGTNGDGVNDPAERNVISGNNYGVVLVRTSATVVAGNFIGTDRTGTHALGNWVGIALLANGSDRIGTNGTDADVAGERNIISGNGFGIAPGGLPAGSGTQIFGNSIGPDVNGNSLSGTNTLGSYTGNEFAGLGFGYGMSNMTVGGAAPGLGNTIADNSGPGVWVADVAGNSTGITVEGNSISGNGGLGIALGGVFPPPKPNGVNTNAANDAANHVGPNNLMNFPVLRSAYTSNNSTTVSGSLYTGTANGQPFLPNATVTLDFYGNSAPDPSGYGQGQTWLGSLQVTTDASGNVVTFTATGLLPMSAGEGYLSATATDAVGNTSEFCADIPVGPTSAAGPYTIQAGDSATFHAVAAGAGPWNYFWEINGQGYGDATHPTGQIPTLTWTQLQSLGINGPGTYTVQAETVDGQGNVTPLPAATLTVAYTPPTATIVSSLPDDDSGNPTVSAGSSVTLTGNVTDPSSGESFNDSWSVVQHAPPAPGTTVSVDQYATRVLGYSSDANGSDANGGGGTQALGEPDGNGWVPAPLDATPYLTVGFDTPVYANGVTIWENSGYFKAYDPNDNQNDIFDYNGFVTRVDVLDANGQYHTVWSGIDPTYSTSETPFQITWTQTSYLVVGIRIYTTNYFQVYPETISNLANIDAVQISGVYDPGLNGTIPLTGSYDPLVNRGHSEQYATTVLNYNSAFQTVFPPTTSQFSGDPWSATQALGEPNDPASFAQDDPVAWSPATETGSPETLALGFAIPVYADGVTVREAQGNGFVTEVDVEDTSGTWHEVWSGTDPTLPGLPTDFHINWAETPYLVTAVEIQVDNNHDPSVFKEIDSVQLDGWFTPDTVVASGTTPNLTFTPQANGTYYATLSATDQNGGVAMTQTTIDVLPSVPPTAHITNPSLSFVGQPSALAQVNLTLGATDPTPGDEADSFSVDWADGSGVQTYTANNGSAAVSHIYAAAGAYQVTVIATDMAGAVSPTATALVVLSTTPGDALFLSGGISAGQVTLASDTLPATVYSPTDLVLVGGEDSADTYTVNFGNTLTTAITIVGSGGTTGGSLAANGAYGDNGFSHTPGLNGAPDQLMWAPEFNPAEPVETIDYSGIANLVMNGGPGNNYFEDPGSNTTINGGPGANTVVITGTSGNGVVINGGASTNNYILDLGSLTGPVTIDNSQASASNNLVVNGALGNNTITASGSQVTAGSQTINVNVPLASETIDGGSGNNQISVSNLTVPVQSLSLIGGGGNNTFTLVNVGSDVATVAVTGSPTGTNQVQVQGSLPPTVLPKNITPTVAVTDAGGNYNGSAFPATATVTGVSATRAASLEGVSPTLTYYAGSSALSGAPSAAGTYTVVATFAGSTDYTSASATKTFTIGQAAPTVSVSDAGGTYTGSTFPATATVTGVSGSASASLEGVSPTLKYYNGGSASGAPLSGAPSAAGTYTAQATFAGSTDYATTTAQATFTIGKATLTVTANNATKVFDQANPTFTDTITGFVNKDPSSVVSGAASLTTTATTTSPVGPYTITPALGTLSAANYTFAFVNGTLTVTLAPSSGSSVFVLSTSAAAALSLSGNAQIQVSGPVDVDSSSSSAISVSGNAQVTAGSTAGSIQVVGKVQSSGNAKLSPSPVAGAGSFGDPLANLPVPSVSGTASSVNLSGNSTQTINPGVYSAISVSGNGKLTMNAGVYVIAGGGFSVTGNGSVLTGNVSSSATGSGVLIYNAGSKYTSTGGTGGTFGGVNLSGNGTISLTAPTTGPYTGILIFQERDNASAVALSGNGIVLPGGVIYAPAAALTMSGNGQFKGSLVVATVNISGNSIAQLAAGSDGTTVYTPAQVRDAYGIDNLSLDGTGQTIAIVDAYDNPDIYQALDSFDVQFSPTDSGSTLEQLYGPASSFLTVLNQQGQTTSLPGTDPVGPGTDNWEVEEALDVEWAHAVAPGAQIVLVEADSQSLADLMTAVATAAQQPGVSVVSMSWGFPEGQAVLAQDEATYDAYFSTPAGHQGVTFVASTGDYGAAAPVYPAFSPNVVAVGGTSLTLNADNSYKSEAGWGSYSSALGTFLGSGGGLSQYESEPAYQQGVQSTGSRTTPDVSFLADPATGAWVADPYNLGTDNPWEVVGGTSLSAPAWAGLLALADQGRVTAGEATLGTAGPTEAQAALYGLSASDYHAVTSGSNGYSAGAGYNLVTGLGTPVADQLVPDLVAYSGGPASATPVAPIAASSLVLSADAGSGSGSIAAAALRVFSAQPALSGAAVPAPAALSWEALPAPVARSTTDLADRSAPATADGLAGGDGGARVAINSLVGMNLPASGTADVTLTGGGAGVGVGRWNEPAAASSTPAWGAGNALSSRAVDDYFLLGGGAADMPSDPDAPDAAFPPAGDSGDAS